MQPAGISGSQMLQLVFYLGCMYTEYLDTVLAPQVLSVPPAVYTCYVASITSLGIHNYWQFVLLRVFSSRLEGTYPARKKLPPYNGKIS